ncbi:hypothetical protein ACJJTC_003373 [Scirpophaga incertulas]
MRSANFANETPIRIRSKLKSGEKDLSGTGGGPGSKTSLTDLEQRVLAIMGGPTAVEGLSEVGEIGFQVASTSQPITMIENIVLPSTSQDATGTNINVIQLSYK